MVLSPSLGIFTLQSVILQSTVDNIIIIPEVILIVIIFRLMCIALVFFSVKCAFGKCQIQKQREKQVSLMTNDVFRNLVHKCLKADPGERPDMASIVPGI